MKKIKEADVEEYLVKRVAECGGVAEKFTSPNRTSVPDRIVSFPWCHNHEVCGCEGWIVFVECKAPGEAPNAAQERDHERRRKMGFRVYVIDTFESVDAFIKAEGF